MTTNLTRTIETLERLMARGADPSKPKDTMIDVVLRRMHDAQRGHPGSSMGGSGAGSGGSPIEAMLEQRDYGGEALAAWHKAETDMITAATRLDRLALEWAPRQPSVKALRDTERANTAAHLCAVCGDEPPVYRSDVNGNLDEPVHIGRWCRDFVKAQGRKPTPVEIERHRKGLRVMVRP